MSKTLVIIGGGFCGVVSAIRFLRASPAIFGRIVLIEKSDRVACGLAYSTLDPLHLLNVPAGKMSAISEDKDHFLRFAKLFDASLHGSDFVPRKLYAEYLNELLETTVSEASAKIEFMQLHDQVIDISVAANNMATVVLASGKKLSADKIIMALGYPGSGNPKIANAQFYRDDQRYIKNPWQHRILENVDYTKPVLLLGSGLTAVDIAASLQARGLQQPMHIISRHGLTPLAHRGLSIETNTLTIRQALANHPVTARRLLHELRLHIRSSIQRNINWRDILAELRKYIPEFWQQLDLAERARFIRHGQAYWDAHRHRVAPASALALNQLIDAGALTIRAGRITDLQSLPDGVQVSFRRRGRQTIESLSVGTVINCTGPSSSIQQSEDPLLKALLNRGLVIADPLQLGIAVDHKYALLDASGKPSSVLYYVGPFLKAQFWEATAVPELREHVSRLISHLSQ